ncbi:MAG: Vancomycin resistance protein [Aeromicrobium sp.]|nr:Vancomycin resistance protein [Aeromicrobium sp.]
MTSGAVLTLAEATSRGFSVPERLTAPPRLTERIPALLPVAVRAHQARRHVRWLRSDAVWATERARDDLPALVIEHSSVLLRELSEAEMRLQHNKVTNLRLASTQVDGILIRPGETFSFNKVVGNCTRRKGYVDGMRLSQGDADSGVGGGLCQLANLLHWMFLHAPLTIVERSEHSFDPFPDKDRVIPWGVGCSIVYNYVDLVVRNDTDLTFQIGVRVGPPHLLGELRADRLSNVEYHVAARNEAFVQYDGRTYRMNEIWRTSIDRASGTTVDERLVKQNCALVKYSVPAGQVIEIAG